MLKALLNIIRESLITRKFYKVLFYSVKLMTILIFLRKSIKIRLNLINLNKDKISRLLGLFVKNIKLQMIKTKYKKLKIQINIKILRYQYKLKILIVKKIHKANKNSKE